MGQKPDRPFSSPPPAVAPQSGKSAPIITDIDSAIIGTCNRICPLEEIKRRVERDEVKLLEQEHPSRPGWTLQMMMVKENKKAASDGTVHNVPHIVRTPDALWRTWSYIKEHIMDIDGDGPDQRFIESNLVPEGQDRASVVDIDGFVWNRSKQINRDLNVQGIQFGNSHPLATAFLEECASYHIWIEYELGPALNKRNLNERMKNLNEAYDGDYKRKKCVNPREAEFRAYYILQHIANPDKVLIPMFIRPLVERPDIINQPIMKQTLALWAAYKMRDYFSYFQIIKKSKNVLFCCQAYQNVPEMRFHGLSVIMQTNKSARNEFPVSDIVGPLGFDNEGQAVEVCKEYGLKIKKSQTGELQLDTANRSKPIFPEEMSKLRSEALIDSKRGPPGQRTRRAVIEGGAVQAGEILVLQEKASSNSRAVLDSQPSREAEEDRDMAEKQAREKLELLRRKKEEKLRKMAEMQKQFSLRKEQNRLQQEREQQIAREKELKVQREKAEERQRMQKKLKEQQIEQKNTMLAKERERAEKQMLVQLEEARKNAERKQQILARQAVLEEKRRQERNRIQSERRLSSTNSTKATLAKGTTCLHAIQAFLNKVSMVCQPKKGRSVESGKLFLKNLQQLRRGFEMHISASLEQAIIEVEACFVVLKHLSLFELLQSAKQVHGKLITDSKKLVSAYQQLQRNIDAAEQDITEAIQDKRECNLAIKFLRFYKWKVIVKAKFGPMSLEIKRQRIQAALSSPVKPMAFAINRRSHNKTSDVKNNEDLHFQTKFELWKMFSDLSHLEHGKDTLWKLVVVVDNFTVSTPHVGHLAIFQRWLLSKYNQGSVNRLSKNNSKNSKLLSLYRVPSMVGLEDDSNETADLSDGKLDNDYLRVCVRSVSLQESQKDKRRLLRGTHAAVFPMALFNVQREHGVQLSGDELSRFSEFLDALGQNASVPVLLPILCMEHCSREDKDIIFESIVSALQRLDVNSKVMAWKACFVVDVGIKETTWETPPHRILDRFYPEELSQGTQWLVDNRTVCPPLAHAPLSAVLQEWFSFMPRYGPGKAASSMVNDFNIILATTMHLLTQPGFQDLPPVAVAPEFLGKDDDVNVDSSDIPSDWNSEGHFQQIRGTLQSLFLPPLPIYIRPEHTAADFPIFEEYRVELEDYVRALSPGTGDLVFSIHNVFGHALATRAAPGGASVPLVSIPWRSIIGMIIDSQIKQLSTFVVYPKEVGEYLNVCNVVRQVRSQMNLAADAAIDDSVPHWCVETTDILIRQGRSQGKRRFTELENQSPNKIDGSQTLEQDEEELPSKRRRMEEFNEAFANEKAQSEDYERALNRMLMDGGM